MSIRSKEAFQDYQRVIETRPEAPPRVIGLAWRPLKSSELTYSDRLFVGRDGLRPTKESWVSDCCLMVIDENHPEGKLISQREKARMALLQVEVNESRVTLSFNDQHADDKLKAELGGLSRSVSFDVQFEADETYKEKPTRVHQTVNILGIDQGPEAAEWLSKFLGNNQHARLVLQKPESPRQRKETAPGLERVATLLKFQDSYPVTGLSLPVLDTFNTLLAEEHPEWPLFEAEHFRMNFLLADINIHNLVGRFFKIGEVYCYGKRTKERCPMPVNNPQTGGRRGPAGYGSSYQKFLSEKHDELNVPEQDRIGTRENGKEYEKPQLGIDIIPLNEGYVSIDDKVEIIEPDRLPKWLFA